MFKIIKNIIREIMYKGIVAYSDALLQSLEKNFKEKDIPLTWHNIEATIRQIRNNFIN